MHWSTAISSGLLSLAAFADARSWQHVGKRSPLSAPAGENFLSHYMATRQAAEPRFANANTTKYSVNGTGIPDVDFDVGESYSGLLSLTDDPDAAEKMFFWFFPSSNSSVDKEILLWLNGGPGCSSLEGLIQENGPFLWQYGTFKPVANPWSWHHLTNIVYVEQPIGTGFSTGNVTATNEDDAAKQLMGFWKNFIQLFGMQGYKVYIAGESYAGMYCPYLASAMLDAKDTSLYNVQGMMIYDPVLLDNNVQTSVGIVPFVDYHSNLMPFNDSFTAYLHQQHEACGFANFTSTYMQYPPPGQQPTLDVSPECAALWNMVFGEVFALNPCFDVYQVATTCPLLWDVLGFPGSLFYVPTGADIYFNRTDVKTAIHAPTEVNWQSCAAQPVFAGVVGNQTGQDLSPPSALEKIPSVIDRTKNVIIGHGMLDMILLANGTLLTIQNMTWGGQLGFQTKPTEPFFVPYHALSTVETITTATNPVQMATMASAGISGVAHTERGLTYVSIDLSGHMVPQYSPSAAFRQLEFLLGRVDSLSSMQPFTTQPNSPQPASAAAAMPLDNGTAAGLPLGNGTARFSTPKGSFRVQLPL